MSTLKVNTIKSLNESAGNPLIIDDSLASSGSTVENDGTNAQAIAFGQDNSTTGVAAASLAGRFNTASSYAATLAGDGCKATSFHSVAMGVETTATAQGAHSEGRYTTASFTYSHAEGYGTTTGASYQHVSGKYNRQNANALTVIGNGTGASSRRNIAEFYSGNMTLSGSLLIVSGSDTIVKIETLPTSDPETAGQLFTTQSAGTGGNLDGTSFRVLCVSQG